MGQDAHLFAAPRRRQGPGESGYAHALTAWLADGHLAGPANADVRAALRLLARSADDAFRDDKVTPYSRSMCVRMYLEARAAYAPRPEPAPVFADTALVAATLANLD